MASKKKMSRYYKYSGVITLLIAGILLAAIALFIISLKQNSDIRSQAATGSGAPHRAHFNLNIIGVSNNKTASMTDGKGRALFVPLTGSCEIDLSQGSYRVLDGNCTDGTGGFQLPNPDPDNDGVTNYSVWARALGKPGGTSKTTTCVTESEDEQLYCSLFSVISVRNKGQSPFINVSKELLYVFTDIDNDGNLDRVPLFDSKLENYLWKYDINGAKIIQLRFYQIPTDVNDKPVDD